MLGTIQECVPKHLETGSGEVDPQLDPRAGWHLVRAVPPGALHFSDVNHLMNSVPLADVQHLSLASCGVRLFPGVERSLFRVSLSLIPSTTCRLGKSVQSTRKATLSWVELWVAKRARF